MGRDTGGQRRFARRYVVKDGKRKLGSTAVGGVRVVPPTGSELVGRP
jgi:hypothetical protein